MADKIEVNVDQLITLVRARPCIWDGSKKNGFERQQKWQEIYSIMHPGYENLQEGTRIEKAIKDKWTTIKDVFQKRCKKLLGDPQAITKIKKYDLELQFLWPTYNVEELFRKAFSGNQQRKFSFSNSSAVGQENSITNRVPEPQNNETKPMNMPVASSYEDDEVVCCDVEGSNSSNMNLNINTQEPKSNNSYPLPTKYIDPDEETVMNVRPSASQNHNGRGPPPENSHRNTRDGYKEIEETPCSSRIEAEVDLEDERQSRKRTSEGSFKGPLPKRLQDREIPVPHSVAPRVEKNEDVARILGLLESQLLEFDQFQMLDFIAEVFNLIKRIKSPPNNVRE